MTNAKSTRDILLQVPSLEAAVTFYGQTLGFAMFMDTPSLAGFETGAFRLFLEPRPALGPVLEVLVDDPAAHKKALVAAGCEIIDDDPSVPRCYIRDPFGLIFNLGKA